MKMNKIVAILGAFALMGTTAACSSSEYAERENVQEAKKKNAASSQDKVNLQRKDKIESKAGQVGYVYIMSFAKPIGYYVIEGKVSSSGGQLTPEQDIVRASGGDKYVVDGPFDDGTYGEREPGIFFFTSDGIMVHTSLDYLYSTEPLSIEVPLLGGEKK